MIIYHQPMPHSAAPLKKLLIVRNDKLGDFMLSLPTLALLRAALPATELEVLLPEYTREIALASGYIDAVIHDPGHNAPPGHYRALRQQLKLARYDAVLTLFSTTRIGWCVYHAGIPYRLAPATKLAQFFYNRRLIQHRSQSTQPEFAYNLELGKKLLRDFGVTIPTHLHGPYLHFPRNDIEALKHQFLQPHGIDPKQPLVFIHPGSGGSAVNLSLGQYARLAHSLAQQAPVSFVFSAGPTEIETAQALGAMLKGIPHVIYHSTHGLVSFARHIACADVFISGSTGPLHIAGALNRPTVGFYPNRRSATALRWQTLSEADRRLAFSPPPDSGAESMLEIDVEHCAQEITQRLQRFLS